jgi:hypothetical protein
MSPLLYQLSYTARAAISHSYETTARAAFSRHGISQENSSPAIRSTIAAKWGAETWEYRSIIDKLAQPPKVCTDLRSTPDATSRLAKVCLRVCGVTPVRPARLQAVLKVVLIP